MKKRRFTAEDQLAFARLSGDYNPLHMDALAARRLIFGAPVVHGMHALLWSLDCLLEDQQTMLELQSLKAVFPKPIKVDDEVVYTAVTNGPLSARIELSCDGTVVTTIKLAFKEHKDSNLTRIDPDFPERLPPRVLDDNAIEADSSTLGLHLEPATAAALFPQLMRIFSHQQMAVILSTTRLVGGLCPGLHSIYSELSLNASPDETSDVLDYSVTRLDKRFGMVRMALRAPGLTGNIKAFRRPAPLNQESYQALKQKINEDEFAGQRALIVGGSRGLGEVVSKLLAAGGAEVKLTYHRGRTDAAAIVDDIRSNGGSADCFSFNVLDPQLNPADVSAHNWAPTHLYYFATPFVFSGAKGVFSPDLFNKFCDYYVSGFVNTVNQLKQAGTREIFYPSTVAIDEIPVNMGEYTAAKVASEMVCAFLEKNDPAMHIHKPRFPRVATDQTASIMPVVNHDPVPLLIEQLRLFRDASARSI